MKTKAVKNVDFLILEDDVFYNNLIAKRLGSLKESPDIKDKYRLKINQFSNAEECLQAAKDTLDSPKATLAFIDYYLGNGINGEHLINLLVDQNERIDIVLMSRSHRALEKSVFNKSNNKVYAKLVKEEFTPDICCIIAEQYIKRI